MQAKVEVRPRSGQVSIRLQGTDCRIKGSGRRRNDVEQIAIIPLDLSGKGNIIHVTFDL